MAQAKKSAKASGKTLEIKMADLRLEKEKTELVIVGTRPLLTHNADAGLRDWIEKKGKQFKSMLTNGYDPNEEWQKGLYPVVGEKNEPVGFGLKAGAIKGAMMEATRGIPQINKTELDFAFYVPGRVALVGQEFREFLLIEGPMPKARVDRVRLSGKGRTADDRWRPEFWPWQLTVPIVFYPSFIKLPVLVGLLIRAGEMVGIGDGRRKLDLGRFVIKDAKAAEAA